MVAPADSIPGARHRSRHGEPVEVQVAVAHPDLEFVSRVRDGGVSDRPPAVFRRRGPAGRIGGRDGLQELLSLSDP